MAVRNTRQIFSALIRDMLPVFVAVGVKVATF